MLLKVLIVEDEEVIRKGLEFANDWMAMGCRVIGTAPDAEEGLRLIKELEPDVVMTDICMPQMTGLEMLEEALKEHSFHSIVLTGFSEFGYAQQAIRMGVVDYLLKPVDEDELKAVVEKIHKNAAKKKDKKESVDGSEGKISTDNDMWKVFEVADKSVDIYVKKTYNIIKERYQDKLSINSVAEELNVSPSFLSRRIKANMNVTFVDMLNQYRVNRALHLLNEGTMRIYEVSDILGFSEYKYFCSVFKKYTGVTPSEFVKNGGMIKVRDK